MDLESDPWHEHDHELEWEREPIDIGLAERYSEVATVIWYKLYIGDYTSDTTDLSAEEEGIYLRLMNWYYKNEMPIPDERACIISRTDHDKTNWVLYRFFKKEIQQVHGELETVWRHERIDAEILDAQPRIKAAKENGKKGGRPRKETSPKNQLGSVKKPSRKPNGKANQNQIQSQIQILDPESDIETPAPARTKKQKHLCPENWKPKEDHETLAKRLGLNCSDQAERMRDYSKSNDWKKVDWDATFRNWLKNCTKYKDRQPVQSTLPNGGYRDLTEDLWPQEHRRATK